MNVILDGTLSRPRWLRVAAFLAISVVLPMFSFAEGAARADTALLAPTDDPFYRAEGPLADLAPGTVLRTRTVGLAPTGTPLPAEATQVLYRTTGQHGEPSATVATVIRPPAATGPLRLVAYQTAYDALGARCNPSYTLRGGERGVPQDTVAMAGLLAAGFTVVTSDYEGPEVAFGPGRKAGYATLDSIRAALTVLGATSSTPVGMAGFSGGSIPTEFAAELAPVYAPELAIVGTAVGGFAVDLANTINYVNGQPDWPILLPLVLQGMARGYGIDVQPYLSDYGKQVFARVADRCVLDLIDAHQYPGLRIEQLLGPEYQDYRSIPVLAQILDQGRMGATGTPKGPLYFFGGNSDGRGDGVMLSADQRALAVAYCRRGIPVRQDEIPGADHLLASILFVPAAQSFLQARFDGAPFQDSCAALTG